MKGDHDALMAWLAVGFGELVGGSAVALGLLLVPVLYPDLAAEVALACSVAVVILAVAATAATAWLLRRF